MRLKLMILSLVFALSSLTGENCNAAEAARSLLKAHEAVSAALSWGREYPGK
jgi:hypothetical protein